MENLVYIRGAGDLASGIAVRLYRARQRIVMADLPIPTAVRRTVAFSEAIRLGEMTIEGIRGRYARDIAEAERILSEGDIAVLADPTKESIRTMQPAILVDAIIAKRNLGTEITDAPLVIGIGPGFTAGEDCHAVVETKRGHSLGRVLYQGSAIENTGVPGNIGGFSRERVMRAPADGTFHPTLEIGTLVHSGDICGMVDGIPMRTEIDGMVRGLLQDGVAVTKGMKSGDVDPRGEGVNFREASDKALAIGGGVLEAMLHFTSP